MQAQTLRRSADMIAVMIRIGNWMLTEPATCKDYLQVRQEGSRRVSRNLRVGEKNKRIKPMQNHYEIGADQRPGHTGGSDCK